MKALGSQSSQSHLSSLPCARQAPGTKLWGEAETEAPALEHLQRRRRAEEEHGTPPRGGRLSRPSPIGTPKVTTQTGAQVTGSPRSPAPSSFRVLSVLVP